MMKRILFSILGLLLLTASNIFADDVSIDSTGNVKTGVSNANAELEVTGASGEGGIFGSASGTGASGVYGINTTYGNYGILGYDNYGIFGYSIGGYAGYFQGNARVTGNLTIDGSLIGPVIGDITGVDAGTGLSGGGSSGDVTLNADTTYLQRRVSTCTVGSSIRAINEDGTVLCETDDAGITSETDPKVGVNSANYVPRWDGSALVSGSIYDNGNVGIGTTNPSNALEVARDQSSSIIRATSYMNDNSFSPGMFIGRRAHGTMAVPGAVQANDYLAVFAGSGYSPTGWLASPSTRGRMDIVAAENWTNTAQGAYVAFRTTPIGTINSVEKMRITDAGNVGIGTTNPAEKLTVAGTIESSSGGIKFPDGTIQTTAATGEGPSQKKNPLEIALLKWYTNTVTSFAVGNNPWGIAFDGANIWVANLSDNNIIKLNAATGVVLGTYSVGTYPIGIAFDGANIWVANQGSANVTKLNSATGAVIGTYSVGNSPQGLAFDGANIWVANLGNNTVTKLNAATGGVIGTYTVSASPQGASRIAFDGTYIWVTNYYDNSVTKFNAVTGGLIGTYYAGPGPIGIAFDGSYIWVVSNASNRISKMNPDTGGVVVTYPVQGNNIAFDGANIWVTSSYYNHITKLKAATGEVIGTYSVGNGSNGIAFDGANIWVTNSGSNTISKL